MKRKKTAAIPKKNKKKVVEANRFDFNIIREMEAQVILINKYI